MTRILNQPLTNLLLLAVFLLLIGGIPKLAAQVAEAEIDVFPTNVQEQRLDSVPLNSSALLLDRRLLEQGPELVRRIAKLGDRRLMLVVTMSCRLNESLQPIEFGLMTDRSKSWSDLRNFEPLNDRVIKEYQQLLAATFAEAAKRELAICVMLHLDPAGAINEWRNSYDFDPCTPIKIESKQAYSYETAMVHSVVMAIKKSVPVDSPIQISLAGELGRSVFAYSSSYEQIANRVRHELSEYSLELGISLNHNDLAGGYVANETQRAETDRLFASLDFVGYSHYRPFAMPPQAEQFRAVSIEFVELLTKLGVKLSPDMPLHLSEVAIGGAPNQRGVAFTDWASAKPWEGTNHAGHNPWLLKPMIELRRAYHKALLEFLSEPSEINPVTAAYLWSEGSWDPMGILSSMFVDPEIQKLVREHNAKKESN